MTNNFNPALPALIFDLDGTLIDSVPDLQAALNKLLASCGRSEVSLEQTRTFVGNGAYKLVERGFRATGEAIGHDEIEQRTAQFLAFYDGHEAEITRPYEAVMETLQALQDKGYPMALCTNKPQQPTENILKLFDMDRFFSVVIGGDQLAERKPHPMMIEYCMDKLGHTASTSIMIGDSPNDIDGGKNAGVKTIAVSYGYRKVSLEEMGADVVIGHFSDLIKVV